MMMAKKSIKFVTVLVILLISAVSYASGGTGKGNPIDTKKEIVSISLETGNENFRVKMNMFSWYEQPRISIIDKKIYLFSLKKTFQLNETTGSLNESKLPSKLNPKEITFLIDEFQIDINTLPNSDGSGVMIDGGGAGDGGGGGGE